MAQRDHFPEEGEKNAKTLRIRMNKQRETQRRKRSTVNKIRYTGIACSKVYLQAYSAYNEKKN